MSIGATLLQIVATGGVAAAASGLVVQRLKERNDLRQWQRQEMLTAAINLAEMADAAEDRMPGTATVEPTAGDSTTVLLSPDDLAEALAAASNMDGRNLRVKLMFGIGSATSLAGGEWFNAIMGMHTTLTRMRGKHGDVLDLGALDQGEKENFAAVLERVLVSKDKFLTAARNEIANPRKLDDIASRRRRITW